MAFSTSNVPWRISDAGVPGAILPTSTGLSTANLGGGSVWLYRSTHNSSAITAAGFFTRGNEIGLRLGDVLINWPQSGAETSKLSLHGVSGSTFATTGSTGSTWGGFRNFTVSPSS